MTTEKRRLDVCIIEKEIENCEEKNRKTAKIRCRLKKGFFSAVTETFCTA
ncbi:MAG: hypothetical protein L6V93_18505 [Clostridiales bacterium]|nr:MAG: hypothetical protein L6V93_18505 [Clostridiales bacterium]